MTGVNKKMITFVCNKNEWPIEALEKFTFRTGARVIIRGYAIIENGISKIIN